MRKGFVDMWMMIGVLMMLLVFVLLLFFQQTGQDALRPELAERAAVGAVLLRRKR